MGAIKAVPSSVFGAMYNVKLRKKLNNNEFTILSSNCMGGIVYHRMGQKFCSPTINLWMTEQDFQRFCLELSYYKNCQLHFFDCGRNFPVAKLGDAEREITIYFLHYKDQADAEMKWNERTKRINEENLFVIATDNDGMTKEDLEKWKKMKCKNKVIFTANQYPELPYVFFLEKYKDKESVGKYVNDINNFTGLRYVERVFDFCDFLNK